MYSHFGGMSARHGKRGSRASQAGDSAACRRRDAGRYARQAHKRGETKVSPLLRITPFPLGREQAHRRLTGDLRHLLPQIRARFARKVRHVKVPAAHFPKATKRADSTPQGCAAPLGWQPIPRLSQQLPGGSRKASFTPARAARPKGNGVDWQEGENRRCSPSCPQRGRAGRKYAVMNRQYLNLRQRAKGPPDRRPLRNLCAG